MSCRRLEILLYYACPAPTGNLCSAACHRWPWQPPTNNHVRNTVPIDSHLFPITDRIAQRSPRKPSCPPSLTHNMECEATAGNRRPLTRKTVRDAMAGREQRNLLRPGSRLPVRSHAQHDEPVYNLAALGTARAPIGYRPLATHASDRKKRIMLRTPSRHPTRERKDVLPRARLTYCSGRHGNTDALLPPSPSPA